MKPSYSWSDRRFLESHASLSPSCNGRGRRRGFQDHHCRRGNARMCSSVAPSPLWISKAIGPLQMRHLPTQLAPTRRKLESVSATRPSRSAGVMGTGALRSGSRWRASLGDTLMTLAGNSLPNHEELADVLERQEANGFSLIDNLKAGPLSFSQPSHGGDQRAGRLDTGNLPSWRDRQPGHHDRARVRPASRSDRVKRPEIEWSVSRRSTGKSCCVPASSRSAAWPRLSNGVQRVVIGQHGRTDRNILPERFAPRPERPRPRLRSRQRAR